MEKNKADKLSELSLTELRQELLVIGTKMEELLKQKMLGKPSKHYELVKVRRALARAKTFITLKEVLEDAKKNS